MAYTTDGSITNFWPDDTDTELYLASSICYSLEDLADQVQKKSGQALR